MSDQTDYRGLPVPDGETPNTVIRWWEVDPHPQDATLILRERSWQRMLAYVRDNLEVMLERDGVLENGLAVKFRVCTGTLEQYHEMED